MSQKIPGLDHLRALAITLVFLYHYQLFGHPQWVETVGSFGWTGVDLFFVLSGYLICSHILRDRSKGIFSVPVFYIKRAFRILPAFLVVVAAYFLFPPLREWEKLPPLWRFLTFTQNFGLDLRQTRTFSHAWSLCIEEQFYFLLPLCILLFARLRKMLRPWMVLLSLFIGGMLVRASAWHYQVEPYTGQDGFMIYWYKWIYYPTYNRLDGLLAGVSIAYAYHRSEAVKAFVLRHSSTLMLSGLAILVGAYFLCAHQSEFGASVFGFPLVALGYGLIVAVFALPGSLINRQSFWPTAMLARLSYAIYLTHKMGIHIMQQLATDMELPDDTTITFLISVAGCLFGAALLYYAVERPFLKWKNKLLVRNTPTQAAKA